MADRVYYTYAPVSISPSWVSFMLTVQQNDFPKREGIRKS